jgi:DNA (cytosine-5)-methyltransferase 1
MTYIEKINTLLVPNPHLPFKVLDLFAGCGGLSLGFEAAGFHTTDGFKRTKDFCTNSAYAPIGNP